MAERVLDRHGRYTNREEYRFATGEAIIRWGQRYGGYAVLHRPHPLFDKEIYYTWHRTKAGAFERMKRGGVVADEDVIPLTKAPRARKKVRR